MIEKPDLNVKNINFMGGAVCKVEEFESEAPAAEEMLDRGL